MKLEMYECFAPENWKKQCDYSRCYGCFWQKKVIYEL